jgi:hypothetical protein
LRKEIRFITFAIRCALANEIGLSVLAILAAVTMAFALLDVLAGAGWWLAGQVLTLGVFGIAGVAIVYCAGRVDGYRDYQKMIKKAVAESEVQE